MAKHTRSGQAFPVELERKNAEPSGKLNTHLPEELKMAKVSLISLAVVGPFLAIIFMNSAKSTAPLPIEKIAKTSGNIIDLLVCPCEYSRCDKEYHYDTCLMQE